MIQYYYSACTNSADIHCTLRWIIHAIKAYLYGLGWEISATPEYSHSSQLKKKLPVTYTIWYINTIPYLTIWIYENSPKSDHDLIRQLTKYM